VKSSKFREKGPKKNEKKKTSKQVTTGLFLPRKISPGFRGVPTAGCRDCDSRRATPYFACFAADFFYLLLFLGNFYGVLGGFLGAL